MNDFYDTAFENDITVIKSADLAKLRHSLAEAEKQSASKTRTIDGQQVVLSAYRISSKDSTAEILRLKNALVATNQLNSNQVGIIKGLRSRLNEHRDSVEDMAGEVRVLKRVNSKLNDKANDQALKLQAKERRIADLETQNSDIMMAAADKAFDDKQTIERLSNRVLELEPAVRVSTFSYTWPVRFTI